MKNNKIRKLIIGMLAGTSLLLPFSAYASENVESDGNAGISEIQEADSGEILGFITLSSATYSQGTRVQLTSDDQVVDIFCGVPAKYMTGLGNTNTGTYSCAGYVSSFYSSYYGVNVWNLFAGQKPQTSNGSMIQVTAPQPGDVGFQYTDSGSGHWFIVKSVSGSVVTIIEQNWKYSVGGAVYAEKNRQVSTSAAQFYRVSSSQQAASSVDEEQAEAFVTRLYTKFLGRNPDSAGLENWTAHLVNGTKTGIEVAQGFAFSNEFKQRNYSNEDYVTALYSTFLDRAPDSAGLADWIKLLENGVSREKVFKGIAESNEYTAICNAYGITRGSVTLTQSRDQNNGITMYVYRCYTVALGRTPDVAGLNNWTGHLLSGTKTAAEVAKGFVFSPEMKGKSLSNTEFTKALYRLCLGREYDSQGLANWVAKLNSGVTREKVFEGFAGSSEFKAIIKSYGI